MALATFVCILEDDTLEDVHLNPDHIVCIEHIEKEEERLSDLDISEGKQARIVKISMSNGKPFHVVVGPSEIRNQLRKVSYSRAFPVDDSQTKDEDE